MRAALDARAVIAAACDAGHPHHQRDAGRRDTTIRDPHHDDPTNYTSRTDWQRALWKSKIDPTSKRYIKQLENLVVDGWDRTFETLWTKIEESLDRGLPITDDVIAEYVDRSVARQLGNIDRDAWQSGFNGLWVGAKEHAYRLTGFDKKEPRRRGQIVDTLEEQAQLARLRDTALQKVKTITDRELRRDILEALARPGAAAKNPTAMANEIIRQERRKLEEAIDDRKVLREEIKSLYDNMLWQVQRITRTETANAYWLSTLTGYREQGFKRIKFNSHTAEQRTCPTCLALDGTEHDIDVLLSEGGRYPLSTLTHPQCFPAGQRVLTRRGIVPIEQVVVGDEVWTHRSRWRPVVRMFASGYDGVLVDVEAAGLHAQATANHPFATLDGWGPAELLDRGTHVICGSWEVSLAKADDHPPVRGQRFGLAGVLPALLGRLVPVATVDLDRELGGRDREVGVEDTDREEGNDHDAGRREDGEEPTFQRRHPAKSLPRLREPGLVLERILPAASSLVGGGRKPFTFVRRQLGEPISVGVTGPASRDLEPIEVGCNGPASNAEPLRHRQDRELFLDVQAIEQLAREVGIWDLPIHATTWYSNHIDVVQRRSWSGRVYNLEIADDHSYICEGFLVHNCRCWPSPIVQHVTLDSMVEMYRDEPDLFAPGSTVFDRDRIEKEQTVEDYRTYYGVDLRDVPVEHADEIDETLDVIRATPYQQYQPTELRFVKDVGATDEFREAVELPDPVLGQVASWVTPDNRLLVSQFSADDGNTISAALLRGWAARLYDETEEIRRTSERLYGREEVGPADLSPDTIETLVRTIEPHTMMRRQMVGDVATVALEKRLREATDERLEKLLTGVGVSAKDRETILTWRRDRPVWTLAGRYVPPEGTTGSERNRFVNRTAEQSARDMFVETTTAFVNDPWTLLERDPETYGWLRDQVFNGREFRNR